MKNDNLTHDWLDYLSEVKSVKKRLLNEGTPNIKKVDTGLNRSPRKDKIVGIVIHITETFSNKSTIDVLRRRGLSTNYEVDQEGNVYEYVDPDKYVSWATGANANEHTIGIDVTNPGKYGSPKNPPFPEVQINALTQLVQYLANKYGFELKLAPDIGPFNWKYWKDKGFTLFRHRNFVNKSCPSHLPMERLLSGVSVVDKKEDILDTIKNYVDEYFSDDNEKEKIKSKLELAKKEEETGVLDRAYDFIKNLGSQAVDKVTSLFAESIDRKLFDIQDNSEKQIYQKYQKYFDALLNFLKKELKITKPVKIVFEEDKKNSKKVLGRTGGYMNEENKIHIFITGRHVKDIMRSLAHEMVHHRQNIRGEFKKAEPTTKGYAQKNPHLRKMEKEAFLKGNMLFRDWEDNYKYRGKEQ